MEAHALEALKSLARDELWRRGELDFKLDPCKRTIHDEIFRMSPQGLYVIEACRKLGKSFLYCLIAIETCIRNPGARVNYACPTGKMASEIVLPIFAEICDDAPPDRKPVWSEKTGHWTFPNGAYVVLFGCEDELKADRGRGPGAILSIVDEGGFIPCLSYVLESVLSPQHLRTGGRTLVGSTPPKSPAHDFCAVADAAMRAGTYAHRDIYAEGIDGIPSPEAYIASCAAAKGMTVEEFKATTGFQREFLGLRVTDADSAVIPEWQGLAHELVKEVPRPPFFDAYVGGDLGFTRDFTGLLFGYWDFADAVLVIERELLLKRASTLDIGKGINAVEESLWPQRKPFRRIIDDPGRMCADLWEQFKLSCSPAVKGPGSRETGLQSLRVRVQRKKLIVHPSCVQLRHQLRTAIYDSKGADLDRTEADGHFDLLMALVYFDQGVVHSRNPYPVGWDIKPGQFRQGAAFAQVQGRASPIARAALGRTPLGRKLLKGRR